MLIFLFLNHTTTKKQDFFYLRVFRSSQPTYEFDSYIDHNSILFFVGKFDNAP